jgi:hypothetical protein
MAARSIPEMLELRVKLPRGYEDYWRLIRELDAEHGAFTSAVVSAETNTQRQSVEHYIARLVAGGIAEIKERIPFSGATSANVYRLLRRPKEAPRLRLDGSTIEEPIKDRLWRAMRALRQFSRQELAFAATIDKPVPAKTAQRYINQLACAGYLTVRAGKPPVYRLKPDCNTGPLSPSVLVTEVVWDRNLRRRLFDDAVLETEVAS